MPAFLIIYSIVLVLLLVGMDPIKKFLMELLEDWKAK